MCCCPDILVPVIQAVALEAAAITTSITVQLSVIVPADISDVIACCAL